MVSLSLFKKSPSWCLTVYVDHDILILILSYAPNYVYQALLYLLLITLSVVGILGLTGAAAPSAGVALVVGLVDMM